ncbi:YhcN/YlaJ family sporulation lipoprotein [Thermolongibacillus altinsuensis]|uniref:YhcN/YlaJ family sporulation lipoprotein n=1 Tax=Thermolongibacillus altinsuensis TaxID=575256 RepID=UPI00242A2C7A|nr:YhcN/YlaJ family sporulation lipoprotein [Thermolongibacillus altinsuensis]GMB07490.1 sporulation cortex protein CoxA [Thermolongibacillus altinsuensis]
MRKKIVALGAVVALSGLVACNNQAFDTRYNNQTRPIGYYSNENNLTDQYQYGRYGTNRLNGNVRAVRDNDGPITEMFDRGTTNRYATNRVPSVDRNFSRADRNYHGHLNTMDGRTRSSYYNNYDGALAEKISKRAIRVQNVKDARTLVSGDRVLVAVSTNGKDDNRVEKFVKQAVAPYTKGKSVHVVTNPSMYNRIRTIDNDIRDGGPMDRIQDDIRSIFNDMGDRIERPFMNRG